MFLRKFTWLISLLAALWLSAESVQAQIFSGTSQSRVMGRANRGPNYFAIMGHVKHPMAYQLPTSAPSLVDFIRFAGGALETTTGEVRIVRGGRAVQQTMLTATSTIKLMPGDLVIVDGGRHGRGKIIRGGDSGVGSSDEGDAARPIQIALVGVLPYPVIMQMTPDVATKRWIIEQLNQDLSIGQSVKVVSRRHFGPEPTLDSRLADNAVLVFPDGLVDVPALPKLPAPFLAGTDRHSDPQSHAQPAPLPSQAAAPIPLPITRPNPGRIPVPATPPGYSALPDTRATGEADNLGDPEATREILTHPGSVPLDEKQPELPGRAHIGDTGSAAIGTPGRNRTAPARPAPDPEATPQDDSSVTFNPEAVPEIESPAAPEAARPFVSQPDPSLSHAHPESTSPRPETSALPLTPISPGEAAAPGRDVPPSPDHSASRSTASPVVDPVAIPREALPPSGPARPPEISPGPSLAAQGAADSQSSSTTSSQDNTAKFIEVSITSPRGNGEISVAGKSRLIPLEESPTSWPLIAAGVIGSLGFLAAFSLLLSMTGPAPSTPAPAAKSDRYWLDKIIDDELPVEEEPATEPVISEMFGKPTNAPTLRLDAAQREIPRPHFMDRGRQSGVGQPRSPQPNIPQPGSKKPNSGRSDTPVVVPTRRTNSPSRTPDVPLAPAATQQSATAATVTQRAASDESRSGEPASEPAPKSHRATRIVRIESSHGPDDAPRQPTGQLREPGTSIAKAETKSNTASTANTPSEKSTPKIAVSPAPSVAAGSDLLDRILAAVQFGDGDTASKVQP